MSEDQDSGFQRNDKLLVRIPEDIDRDLQWYFERGPSPELTRKQRERWTPIHRALNGACRRLCLYYQAINDGKNRHEATLASYGDGCTDDDEPYDFLRFELQTIVIRLEAATQRGRPKSATIDHIVVPLEWLDFEFVAGFEIVKDGNRGQLPETRFWKQVPIVLGASAAHWVQIVQLHRGQTVPEVAALDWSTWGDVRIDATGSSLVARELGLYHDASLSSIQNALENLQKRKSEKEPTAPRCVEVINATDFSLDDIERRLGNSTTTVTEISNWLGVSCTVVRTELGKWFRKIARREEIQVSWLRSPEAMHFYRGCLATKHTRTTGKVNYRGPVGSKVSARNNYIKYNAQKAATRRNSNTL